MSIIAYPRLTNVQCDRSLILLWLKGKRPTTQTTYAAVARQFLDFVDKPLAEVVLEDLLIWVESLQLRGQRPTSINNKIAAIRSLFSFAWKCGYLSFNVAKAVKTQTAADCLHERILERAEVKKLIAAAPSPRELVLLSLIYHAGLRVSEVCGLDWHDLKPRATGGQGTVVGKGGKTRTVLISQSVWQQLMSLPKSDKTEAVFVSHTGRRLERTMVHRIIKTCAARSGVNPNVSTHWLRHSHASHSLENGCDIDVLMRSLGHSSLTVTSKYLHARPNEGSSQFVDI